MAPRSTEGSIKKDYNKGAWTAEEDTKISQYIEVHGAKKWKTVATKSGLNRCGKSCRLRWLNYLRPNIKRGNISNEEEDLIIRLHKLLGNRWSLIAGRLPGRTDNEIKNYWNSHLSKKINRKGEITTSSMGQQRNPRESADLFESERERESEDPESGFDVSTFFDFSTGGTYGLDWVKEFIELDNGRFL